MYMYNLLIYMYNLLMYMYNLLMYMYNLAINVHVSLRLHQYGVDHQKKVIKVNLVPLVLHQLVRIHILNSVQKKS